MTDEEVLQELTRRFDDEHGRTPFPIECDPLVELLSFTNQSILLEQRRDAWSTGYGKNPQSHRQV